MIATEHLKTRVEHVWNRAKDDRILSSSAIGNWSKYVE
jgi:hypothetical protein